MNDNDFEFPNPELLTYVQTGVLWINKEPEYVVDLIKQEGTAFVHVFAVHDKKDRNPRKLAVLQSKTTNRFSSRTRLGDLANKMLPAKTSNKWVVKPPLFTAPIVQGHRNTFTQEIEPGFFEREPDRDAPHLEEKVIRGKNTGIFIGLSSITWEDRIRISKESLVESITKYRKGNSFYDFTGRDSDPNNPLSSGYNKL